MTEKRFQNKMRMVIDTEKNFGARVLTPEEIVDLLNEQHEQIQILKATNGEMEDYLARLEEENEQLEQRIKELSMFKPIMQF